jgi:hypothetical protein
MSAPQRIRRGRALQVDCSADGKLNRFPLELRASSSPTEEMPAPTLEIRQARPGAHVQPALAVDEATGLSPEELVRRGYPPPPDPQQTPEGFATWLKVVKKPRTSVPPRLVANPGVRHAVARSRNWNGSELDGPPQSYDFVEGDCDVPSILLGNRVFGRTRRSGSAWMAMGPKTWYRTGRNRTCSSYAFLAPALISPVTTPGQSSCLSRELSRNPK